MGKSKKERFAELAAKQVDDGQAIIEGVKPVSLGEHLSPLNVRKVKLKHIEALASDIKSHGVLQNLIVYKNGRGYKVCAGGRHFRAQATAKAQGYCSYI